MKTFCGLLTLFVLASCTKHSDPQPVEIFSNTSVESGTSIPTSWWFNVNGTSATFIWTNDIASSGSRSIEISSTGALTNVAYWGQSINQNIPRGKNLTLKLKVKGNLSGTGAAAAIACLNATSSYQAQQFSTTEGSQSMVGAFDWKTYTISLNGVHSDITEIRVYLMLLQGGSG